MDTLQTPQPGIQPQGSGMEYGRLLERAWILIWTHKFLIALGVLAALGGNGGGTSNFRYQWQSSDGAVGNGSTVKWPSPCL